MAGEESLLHWWTAVARDPAFMPCFATLPLRHFFLAILVLIAGCQSAPLPAGSSDPSASTAAPSAPHTDAWLGRWNGPEGTYLLLSKDGAGYTLTIASLDGPETYPATPAGDHIEFQRNGLTESIRAGNGQATGMKWLLDKTDCLVIKTGEGFCRD